MSERLQCTAIRNAGGRCQSTSAIVMGLCAFHDPSRREQVREMRRRGAIAAGASRAANRKVRLELASASAGPRPPIGDSLLSVTQWVRWLAEAGIRGEVKQSELVALTSVARLLVQSLTQRDLEVQLRKLQRDYLRLKKQLEHGK